MMPTVPITNVGQYGIIKDAPAHTLPPNAWSDGQNVRARINFIEKFLGHSTTFGTLSNVPYNLLQTNDGSDVFWVLAGLTNVYAYDGSAHTDISRTTGGAYAATATKNWTLSNFQGIPILNNGFDVPQMWTPVNVATALQALSNWPATDTCAALRPFRNFLVAMDLTKSSVRYAQTLKWSHPAAANSVPSSWDETDATKDVGEADLADTLGAIVDGVTMRDVLIVYKDDSVYGMQYVGGETIMRVYKIFNGFGILSRRCAVEYFFGRHLVLGVDDIYTHDGQTKQSVIDGKLRKWLYSQINSSAYETSFVALNTAYTEVWCCVPTGSATLPNLAVVWNWVNNTISVRDLTSVAGAYVGNIFSGGPDYWDLDSGTWDSDPTPWSSENFSPTQKSLLFAQPSPANVLLVDDSNLFDATIPTAYVERKGLGVPFRANQPPDISSMKFLSAVWPRIQGASGGVVKVSVGSQMDIYGNITWQPSIDFTIGTSTQIPARISGRTFAVRFESDTNTDWKLMGYDLDVKQVGRF